MRKKREIIRTMLISTVLTFIIFSGLVYITSNIYETLTNKLHDRKINMLQGYARVMLHTSLLTDSESIEKLKDSNDTIHIIYDGEIEKELYKASTYKVITEDLLNVEIYEIANNSANLVYKYYKDTEATEIDLTGVSRNHIDEMGEVIGDKFVVIVPIENNEDVNIGLLKIISSASNYIEETTVYKKMYHVVTIIILIIAIAVLINKYMMLLNTFDQDALTGLTSKSRYKTLIGKLIDKNPNEKGELIIIGFRDIEDFEMQNVELIEEVIFEFSHILKKYKNFQTIVSRVSEQKLGIYRHDIVSEKELLEKLIVDVEQFLRNNKKFQSIQYYMGVAYYPEQEKTVEALVNGAIYSIEKLKREKKQYHTNNYLVYDPKAHREFLDKQYLFDELQKIMKNRNIYIVFQPIVDLKTGKIFGYEALSRPISNLIPNIAMLLTIGDEMKVTSDLEMLLIYQTNKTVYSMKEKFEDKYLFINTNVSIKYGQKEIEKFRYIIDKIAKNLVIEITEYNEIDFNTITEKVKKVKEFGAMIAIDDFGSGYSNELALLSLLPDLVKIDMGLIRDIDKDSRKLEIVQNLTTYAKKNNIKVLAEGVETKEELKVVMDLDIDYVQGYIFAKPDRELLDKTFDIDKYL